MSFIYIPVGKGLETIVDADVPREILLARWTVNIARSGKAHVQGWVRFGDYGRTVGLHQVLMNYFGPHLVDHKNLNGLDNRRDNLRIATPAQNSANRTLSAANKTGFKGVRLLSNGTYVAGIGIDGWRRHLGTFRNPEDAARAYDAAALAAFGEFARLNFPEDAA